MHVYIYAWGVQRAQKVKIKIDTNGDVHVSIKLMLCDSLQMQTFSDFQPTFYFRSTYFGCNLHCILCT